MSESEELIAKARKSEKIEAKKARRRGLLYALGAALMVLTLASLAYNAVARVQSEQRILQAFNAASAEAQQAKAQKINLAELIRQACYQSSDRSSEDDSAICRNAEVILSQAEAQPDPAPIPAVNGATIVPGKDGKNGLNGKDGKDGINGKDGLNGKDGKNGVDGKDGRNGIDGVDGEDGESIPGADGKNGADGANGINGANGKDGAPGPPGPIGPPGPTGPIGPAGEPGAPGADGASGSPGADGATVTAASCIDGALTLSMSDGRQLTVAGSNACAPPPTPEPPQSEPAQAEPTL